MERLQLLREIKLIFRKFYLLLLKVTTKKKSHFEVTKLQVNIYSFENEY